MPWKRAEHLHKIAYSHKSDYCISYAEYRSAQDILPLCKECDRSAGEGQQRNWQSNARVVVKRLVQADRRQLDEENYRLAYEEKHKAFETGLPCTFAV